ncbi:MAG TPA: transposase, partial [Niabella sp.]|nr:transposase [Niabella sp.]
LKSLLSQAPGYNRFVQLKPRILPLMILYLNLCHPTALVVCHSRRIYSHKVFSEQVRRGNICAGWFYGFKLFLVINVFGEIIKVMFTIGNMADSNTEHMLKLLTNSKVRYLSTEGFINQKVFEQLLSKGLTVVAGIRSNMKSKLMNYNQKYYLKSAA